MRALALRAAVAMLDAATNATLCAISRDDGGLRYGSGHAAGEEAGYIVGFRTCSWGVRDAPRLRPYQPLRFVVEYDARRYLAGVMGGASLFGHLVDGDAR